MVIEPAHVSETLVPRLPVEPLVIALQLGLSCVNSQIPSDSKSPLIGKRNMYIFYKVIF